MFDQNRDLLFAFLDADGDGPAQSVMSNRFLNGATVDQVLADELVNGSVSLDTYWPLADNLGSNRDVVRRAGSSTVSVEHLRFDAFGEILFDDNATYTQRQSYAGLEFDADIGLYYAWHRWYDPAAHRFISEDPIAYDYRNLARYVRNNPINRMDPTGLEPEGAFTPDMDVDEFYRRILGRKVGDARYTIYREGCQGLLKLRQGGMLFPKGTRCFSTLDAALHYSRQLVEDGHLPHVFAYQSGAPMQLLAGQHALHGELIDLCIVK